MGHGIEFVDELPDGLDFLFIGTPDGGARILYRESAVCPRVLEDSWAAYRRLVDDDGGGGGGGGESQSAAEPDVREGGAARRLKWRGRDGSALALVSNA